MANASLLARPLELRMYDMEGKSEALPIHVNSAFAAYAFPIQEGFRRRLGPGDDLLYETEFPNRITGNRGWHLGAVGNVTLLLDLAHVGTEGMENVSLWHEYTLGSLQAIEYAAMPHVYGSRAFSNFPDDVHAFASKHGILNEVAQFEEKAKEIFPGFVSLELSVEEDPEVEEWQYLGLSVKIIATPQSAVEALKKLNAWLSKVLPGEKLLLVAADLEFAG